ncbi:uncharacterized protein [Apostichopus japonicus]|uniref:uncharacterized protein isoform X2 n=1 Tax=Stichopus japonicus TaxID=307972 RepID=UPI003AB8A94D
MEDLGSQSKASVNSNHLNLQRILKLQRNITNLMINLNNSYDELQRKMHTQVKVPMATNDELLRRAGEVLSEIKERDFQNVANNTIQEHRSSVATFEMSSSSALRLTELRGAIVNVSQTLSDLRDDLRELLNMSDASGTKIRAASSLNNHSAKSLKTLKKYSRRTESIVKKIMKMQELADELTNSSKSLDTWTISA